MKDRKIQRWIRKIAVVLLALVLVLGIPVNARADGGVSEIDPDRKDCSITLTLAYKDNGKSKELKGGEISLYTVATVKEEDGYIFDVTTGKFAGVEGVSEIPKLLEADEDEEISIQLKNNSDLAKKLETPAAKAKADSTKEIADGKVSFTGLKPGLYLIVQTKLSEGDRKVNSFLVSIPDEEGNYQIEGDPKAGVYVPEPPTETETKQPPKKPKGKLPQTGQLWWPVPVMAIAGTVLLTAGIMSRKKEKA